MTHCSLTFAQTTFPLRRKRIGEVTSKVAVLSDATDCNNIESGPQSQNLLVNEPRAATLPWQMEKLNFCNFITFPRGTRVQLSKTNGDTKGNWMSGAKWRERENFQLVFEETAAGWQRRRMNQSTEHCSAAGSGRQLCISATLNEKAECTRYRATRARRPRSSQSALSLWKLGKHPKTSQIWPLPRRDKFSTAETCMQSRTSTTLSTAGGVGQQNCPSGMGAINAHVSFWPVQPRFAIMRRHSPSLQGGSRKNTHTRY